MALTYEPIATTTLGSDNTSVTFSSIPSTYTDLVLVICGTQASQSDSIIRFNSDSGSTYSRTAFYQSGTSTASLVQANQSGIAFSYFNTSIGMAVLNINNYANSTIYKTVLSAHNGAGATQNSVTAGTWRNTAAITTIDLYSGGSTYAYQTGTIFTLYGIKAA